MTKCCAYKSGDSKKDQIHMPKEELNKELKMNEIFEQLLDSGWEIGGNPYSLINEQGYVLIEDTGSWMTLISPEKIRIWDYPVLSSYKDWLCNSIARDCDNNLVLKNQSG